MDGAMVRVGSGVVVVVVVVVVAVTGCVFVLAFVAVVGFVLAVVDANVAMWGNNGDASSAMVLSVLPGPALKPRLLLLLLLLFLPPLQP